MIILTAAQATQVRGISPTVPSAGLWPVPLTDGTFMLPEAVLTDPAHADVKALLTPLAGKTVATAVLPPELPKVGATALQIIAVNNYTALAAAVPTLKAAGVRSL